MRILCACGVCSFFADYELCGARARTYPNRSERCVLFYVQGAFFVELEQGEKTNHRDF